MNMRLILRRFSFPGLYLPIVWVMDCRVGTKQIEDLFVFKRRTNALHLLRALRNDVILIL